MRGRKQKYFWHKMWNVTNLNNSFLDGGAICGSINFSSLKPAVVLLKPNTVAFWAFLIWCQFIQWRDVTDEWPVLLKFDWGLLAIEIRCLGGMWPGFYIVTLHNLTYVNLLSVESKGKICTFTYCDWILFYFYVYSYLGRHKMKHTVCILHDQDIEGYIWVTAEEKYIIDFPL